MKKQTNKLKIRIELSDKSERVLQNSNVEAVPSHLNDRSQNSFLT